MKIYRIKAILIRHLLLTFRVLQRLIDLLFWPFINLVIWGFNSIWNEQFQHQSPVLTYTLVTSLIIWQILFRANMEICFSLLEEITSHNFCALFSTPLQLKEWMIAVTLIGLIKSCFTFLFGVTCIWFLYNINILSFGLHYIPFIFLGILTGWTVGFLTASCIILWGHYVRELIWVVAWIFVPFSGIFYSTNVLPQWAQNIAFFLPQSHLFNALRSTILTKNYPSSELLICLFLALLYFVITLFLFKYMFEKSRNKGLARLET